MRTELKEIDPPKDVEETMNKVVKAENEKEYPRLIMPPRPRPSPMERAGPRSRRPKALSRGQDPAGRGRGAGNTIGE